MATLHESAAAAEVVEALTFPFTRGRYRHVLLARAGHVCLVERTSTHRDSRGAVHFEVIVVQLAPATTWPDGRVTPAHERYPQTLALGCRRLDVPDACRGRTGLRGACRRAGFPVTRGTNRGTPSPPTLRSARSAAARGDVDSNAGHSRRPLDLPPPADPGSRAPDTWLGLRRRPIAPVVFAHRPMLARPREDPGA